YGQSLSRTAALRAGMWFLTKASLGYPHRKSPRVNGELESSKRVFLIARASLNSAASTPRRSLLEREAQCKLDPAGTREAVRRNELGVDHAKGAGVGDIKRGVQKIRVVEDVEAVE